MTAKEMRLAAYFLDWFCGERDNAGCNNMPREALEAAQFDLQEDQDFARQCLDAVSGDWSNEVMEKARFMSLQDTWAIQVLALKLRTEADFKQHSVSGKLSAGPDTYRKALEAIANDPIIGNETLDATANWYRSIAKRALAGEKEK